METPEGGIFESNAIARHVARLGNASVAGASAFEAGLIDSWLDFASNEFESAVITWLGPVLGFLQYNKAAVDKAKETLFNALAILNGVLARRTYLVSNRVTLADIVNFCTLFPCFKFFFDRQVRAKYPHVSRWFGTLLAQPNFAAVVGPFQYCEVAAEPAPPKKGGDKQQGGASSSGDAAPAAEKPKKGGKKQETKKTEAPVEEAAPATTSAATAEEPEEDTYVEPKKKNPLDDLPKSNFNLEEWKRVYSNAKNTRNDALPWLWEHFDPQGYSFWVAKYKYNDELKQAVFKTANLVGGFHQRCDECRKYAFSSMLILGTPEAQSVAGVWLLRGTEFPAVVRPITFFS